MVLNGPVIAFLSVCERFFYDVGKSYSLQRNVMVQHRDSVCRHNYTLLDIIQIIISKIVSCRGMSIFNHFFFLFVWGTHMWRQNEKHW